MMKVKIKKLRDCTLPRKQTIGSAWYDIYAPDDMCIPMGRSVIKTGFAIELPISFHADVDSRSGYSLKGFEDYEGKRRNCDVIHGMVDSDYRDEVGVIVHNKDRAFRISKGQRIAQLVIVKDEDIEFVETDILTSTERKGGFGSTNMAEQQKE